jgi:cephalosporin-C deacetylase-like acetyl esterase
MESIFNYPTIDEINEYWCEALSEIPKNVEPIEKRDREALPSMTYDRHTGGTWLRFVGVDGLKFWCFWQPCNRPGAHKTLIHVPGYGTEASAHPSLVHAGYNVMHVNPRGYCGPDGFANPEWRLPDGTPTVIFRNLDKPKEYGYRFWFQDAVIAVRWLQNQPNVTGKFGFFGSSQGGGASLLLASILSTEGISGAVVADVPFLTNVLLVYEKSNQGAYGIVFSNVPKDEALSKRSFRTLGYVDTVAHASRMNYPVLLTIGSLDDACPPYSIYSLYEKLPNTRGVVEMYGQGHAYTPPLPTLAETWFNLYL